MEQIRHAIEQELVISPNTVVKAYTELDREGVIELRHGAGRVCRSS